MSGPKKAVYFRILVWHGYDKRFVFQGAQRKGSLPCPGVILRKPGQQLVLANGNPVADCPGGRLSKKAAVNGHLVQPPCHLAVSALFHVNPDIGIQLPEPLQYGRQPHG